MIRIVIAGPRGRMGREAVSLVHHTEHFELVAVVDRMNEGKTLAELDGFPAIEAPIFTDLERCLQTVQADVLIDLTTPEVGKTSYRNRIALWRSACCWHDRIYRR
ncbi:MAG: hypothetical protein KatS3mg080_1121 [Anoxybacillus sp.]|nr:MAG: hypothetical protein KatS3mg080_1121 [Anoxybacillus sp.]